jgi:integrase
LEWRFEVNGHEYSKITDLADTERNRIKVQRMEAEARRLVLEGRAAELRLQVQPFISAADAFIEWAKGEYNEHPSSWKRLAVSMTSLKEQFGKRPLGSVTTGDIEDYKSVRRAVHQVREVTLRHDLHALSLLFQYGKKHNWCKGNPVEEVDIPSDAEAVRMHVLTPAEEAKYLGAIDALMAEKIARKRPYIAQRLKDLRDLAVLMLNQGCRPEELRQLQQSEVDLERGRFYVYGKPKAAKRWLRMTTASRSIFAVRMATPGRWIFPSTKSPGKHIGAHQRLHEAALKKSALAFVPYDLRHTAATRWAEAGIDVVTIAAWLGHANLRTVMKYVHPSKDHLHAQAERFEKVWLAMQDQKAEEKERVN